MKILLAPYAKPLRNGNQNAKNYPIDFCKKLIELLEAQGHTVVQVGTSNEPQLTKEAINNLSFNQIVGFIKMADTFIGVDSFLQHAAAYAGKKGIVLWSISDPKIYGYDLHINLLKDRKNVRQWPQQFDIYEGVAYNPDLFVSPEEVVKALEENFHGNP